MQLASLASIFAGSAMSLFFSLQVRDFISPRWIEHPGVARIVASMGCFLVGVLIIKIIAHIIKNLLEKLKLEKYDRFMGSVIGFIKGLLLCTVLIAIGSRSSIDSVEKNIEKSVLGGKIEEGFDFVADKVQEKGVIQKAKDAGKKVVDKAKKIIHERELKRLEEKEKQEEQDNTDISQEKTEQTDSTESIEARE
jgi:uncharacterized membrane protein required for colicin V production